MTIAVGYKCFDGVVLAADTEYTWGDFKIPGRKLFTLPHRENYRIGITGDGSVDFIKAYTETLNECLDETMTDRGIKKIVGATLRKFYRDHVYALPDSEREGYYFNIILGMWSKDGGFSLMMSEKTAVHWNHEAAYVGTGAPFAAYLMDSLNRTHISAEDAALASVYAVKLAKKYAVNCGKDTHLVVIQDHGKTFCMDDRLYGDTERFFDRFGFMAGQLFSVMGTQYFTDDDAKMLLGDFSSEVMKFRQRQKDRSHWRDLLSGFDV
ncbi:MAG: hypothetical protein LAO31_05535 [Acidobacteriia bacterium]|nr:hypothetical protein [Terriglobia bacterium]